MVTPYTPEMVELTKVLEQVNKILEPYDLRMREAVGGILYFDAVVQKALEEAGGQGFDDYAPIQIYILDQLKHYMDNAFPVDDVVRQ